MERNRQKQMNFILYCVDIQTENVDLIKIYYIQYYVDRLRVMLFISLYSNSINRIEEYYVYSGKNQMILKYNWDIVRML